MLNVSNKNKQVLPCLINLSSIYLYNILFVIENTNQRKRNEIFSFELLSLCGHYMEHYLAEAPFPFFESHTTALLRVLLQTVLSGANA